MQTKQRKGRSFLGTFFLVAIGFALGFYNVEILSALKNTVQSISH